MLAVLPPRGVPRFDDWGVLSAGCGRPARTTFGFLVRALAMVVPASKCSVCCLSLVAPRICWRVGGTGDMPVEALFPQGRERFELASSGWSPVLGIDAVGGPPHCDFADESGARVASGRCPGWLGVALAGLILDQVGEVDDQVGHRHTLSRGSPAWRWMSYATMGPGIAVDTLDPHGRYGGYAGCGERHTSSVSWDRFVR